MNRSAPQPLPLGQSDFAALRKDNAVYVDKTELVFELARNSNRILLTRPRRFGKSLLLSTFASLFAHGLRDFGGLAIEKLWTDRTYPVVRLDFSKVVPFSDFKTFKKDFHALIANSFASAGYVPGHDADDAVRDVGLWMQGLAAGSLVVLIDEYDAPLTQSIGRRELFGQVQKEIGRFFNNLKSESACLRFLFVTGIARFAHDGIFSGLNNLRDISLDSRFGALLGFTDDELQECFPAHLANAGRYLGLDAGTLMQQLQEHYDGYCFDRQAKTRVYCPWAVLNFLAAPYDGFLNYWYESGSSPDALLKHLSGHGFNHPASFNPSLNVRIGDLADARTHDDMNAAALLMQAGYLTIRAARANGIVTLGYPNREVRICMAQLYADMLLGGKHVDGPYEPMLCEIMERGDVEGTVARINRAFEAIDSGPYPARDGKTCRAYLEVLFVGEVMPDQAVNRRGSGHGCLKVRAGHRLWVFEVGYAEDSSEVPALLESACERLRSLTVSYREMLRVALVFDGRSRSFYALRAD